MAVLSNRQKTFDGQPVFLFGEISRGKFQDFYKLQQECIDSGTLFEDSEFPANDKSLFHSATEVPYKWLRPPEICKNPRFFVDGFSRFDVRQGILGDCWLLAAAANLTEDQNLFSRVVCVDNSFVNMYAGIFHFRFWQYGKWIDVVVDDRLPTYEGELVYMHSTNLNELWSALLEKAYAKLHGCYEALKGGSTCEALSDFTGGITETFELDVPPSNLFVILEKGFERGSMMGCIIYPKNSDPDYETPEGLICSHAYSINKAKSFFVRGGFKQILRLRNPWGNEKEWNGAWCDGSDEWSLIDDNLKQELTVTFDSDGEFWISFEDFIKHFDHLEICNLSPDCLVSDKRDVKWNLKEFKGEWMTGVSAGGCRNFVETFHQNPQYVMNLKEPGEVVIALMQKNRRSKRKEVDFLKIGFMFYRLNDEDLDQKPQKTDFFRTNKSIGSSNFMNLREVSRRFFLEAGNYLIIPSTLHPNLEGDFWIRIFSESCGGFEEHDEMVDLKKRDLNDENSKTAIDLFEKFANFDSQIGWKELKQILDCSMYSEKKNDQQGFSKEMCRSMVAMLDVDYSGKLEFEEFKILFNEVTKWKTVFLQFDCRNSDTLQACDLREALKSCGYHLNIQTLCSILHRFGTSENTIEFEDFIMCAVKLRNIVENFRAKSNNGNDATFTLHEVITNVLYS